MKKQDVQYIVDEKNRVVVATISGCKYDAVDKIDNKFVNQGTSDIYIGVKIDSCFLMPNTFKAIARCCPEDEWNENVGKKIACDRLTEKYEKALNKRMARFVVKMDEILNSMSKYLEGKEF